MPSTLGFLTQEDLTDHFTRHRAEFGFAYEIEYLAAADDFLGGTLDPQTTRQCHRRNGDLLRCNPLKTYYKPDPADHRQENNLVYFLRECRK